MPIQTLYTNKEDFCVSWQAYKVKFSLEGVLLEQQDRRNAVQNIIERVITGGDRAIAEMTSEFDGVDLKPDQFRVSDEDLRKAHSELNSELLKAIQNAIENVKEYQTRIKVTAPDEWTRSTGERLGVKYTALNRIGACVPGASAPLPSTVIMSIVPAQAAGVKETAVISAPRFNGDIHPVIKGVCYELGVTDVYRISGAQAVAALALGTKTIRKVEKIVGPSNIWGQLAKKEMFGLVDIDSFAGPSDVLVLADKTANAEFVAADMLSQAEHAPGSAVLITDSIELAEAVTAELEKQLEQLGRAEATRQCIEDDSLIVVANDMEECISLANDFAAEHLQIECDNADEIATKIVNAGAIFIGHYCPVACGDYFAGPSHTLPTGGSSKIFGPLNVNDFIKQSSIISYNKEALSIAADSILKIADVEGLDAHARSVSRRLI